MALVALLIVAAAGLLGHPVAGSWAAHSDAHAFCSSPGPRDYAAPLVKLPPINEVPAPSKRSGVGNLPFGPGTVEMYVDTEGPVIVRPGRFGYAFWDVGFERNRPERDPKLDWLVTAQLMELDATGVASDEVAHGHIRIARINDAYQPSLNLRVPNRVGFYRYDVQISNAHGNLLGSFGQYLRVIPHSVKVRLGINGRRFRPGETLATRPEELGTDWISFGEAFEVQRWSEGRWRSYRMHPEFWNMWGGLAGPGAGGRCSYLHIPADTRAGRYRVVKNVGVDVGRAAEHGVTLTAPFSVVTPELTRRPRN